MVDDRWGGAEGVEGAPTEEYYGASNGKEIREKKKQRRKKGVRGNGGGEGGGEGGRRWWKTA